MVESYLPHPRLPRKTDQRLGWLCKETLFVVGWGEGGRGFTGQEEVSLSELALVLALPPHHPAGPTGL